jgi:hypothetical protein
MNIIKTIEDVFFANGRYWGRLNSSLYNSCSIWAMNTGIKSADLNMVWNEKPLTVDDYATIRDVKKRFQEAGLPFWWWVFPSVQPQSTGNMLKAEGFSLRASIPCMLADLTTLSATDADASLQISPVSNKEELFLWEEISFKGFDFSLETSQQYHQFVGTFNLNSDSPQRLFLAYSNGKPVATSLLFLQGNASGIYFVSTLPQLRKKGIGLDMTYATMRYAKQAGALFATLQSSPAGFRIYQQAGFQEYCRADVYRLTTS